MTLPMQPVPDDGACEAEDVSDHGCNHDEHNRRYRIEWFDEVNRLDHVRPENEVEDRLRPADENKKRPPPRQSEATTTFQMYQPNLVGN